MLRQIAEHIAHAPAVGADALERRVVESALIDTLACARAARGDRTHTAVEAYAASLPAGDGHLWSTGGRVEPQQAALLNGAAAHLLDFDDVAAPLRGHPSAVLLPALLAVAGASEATGQQVVDAYAIGFEVAVAMAEATMAAHYPRGWHPSATFGALGATAAVARLTGSDATTAATATSLAVSQLAGTRAQFGTSAKAFQVGAAAATGVRSVAAARAGFTASGSALGGTTGSFTDLYAPGTGAVDLDLRTGPERRLAGVGVIPKLFPVCFAADIPVRAAVAASRDIADPIGAIDRVRVTVPAGAMGPLVHPQPTNVDEARFSLPFAVALAITGGWVGLDDLNPDRLGDRELRRLMGRIDATEAASVPHAERIAEVVIELSDGTVRTATATQRAATTVPVSEDDSLQRKIESCLAWGDPDGPRLTDLLEALPGWWDGPATSILQPWERDTAS